jgi:hypothetical protein
MGKLKKLISSSKLITFLVDETETCLLNQRPLAPLLDDKLRITQIQKYGAFRQMCESKGRPGNASEV